MREVSQGEAREVTHCPNVNGDARICRPSEHSWQTEWHFLPFPSAEQTQVGVIIKTQSTGARKGSHFNRRRVGTKAGGRQGGWRNPNWAPRRCERKQRQPNSSTLHLVPCGVTKSHLGHELCWVPKHKEAGILTSKCSKDVGGVRR